MADAEEEIRKRHSRVRWKRRLTTTTRRARRK